MNDEKRAIAFDFAGTFEKCQNTRQSCLFYDFRIYSVVVPPWSRDGNRRSRAISLADLACALNMQPAHSMLAKSGVSDLIISALRLQSVVRHAEIQYLFYL